MGAFLPNLRYYNHNGMNRPKKVSVSSIIHQLRR